MKSFVRIAVATAAAAATFVLPHAAAQEVDPVGLTPTPPPPPGMVYAADQQHRVASHACAAGEAGCAVTTLGPPAGIARSPSNISSTVKVLQRRGTTILYVPEVAGAADYRAYIVGAGVTFVNGDPRGAVIACSGYRQHPRILKTAGGSIQLEVARQFELPSRISGSFNVVVEAIDRPCPFVGVPGHKNGRVSTGSATVNGLPWVGTGFDIVSFNDVRTATGNEFLNGQGASSAYDVTLSPNAFRGQKVGYVQPRILARAVLQIGSPANDEEANAPLLDMNLPGNAGVFDDFTSDGIVKFYRSLPSNRGGDQIWAEGADPIGQTGPRWFYWINRAQKGVGDTDSDDQGQGMTGAQVWKRHGRLFAMLADHGQQSMSGIHFTSKDVPTRPIEDNRYVRSFFRVDGNGSMRRYWHWALCGAATDQQLVKPNGDPLARFNLNSFFYTNETGGSEAAAPTLTAYPGVGTDGVNPTVKLGEFSSAPGDAFDPRSPGPGNNLECLQVASFDGIYQPAFIGGQNRWYQSGLRAFVNPAGKAIGVHSLVSAEFTSNAGNPAQYFSGAPSHYHLAGSPGSPLIDHFLLPGVPAHFDIYTSRNRMVVYVNGRMGMCVNFDRPLQMARGKIIYGQVLYHTHGEAREIRYGTDGYRDPTGQFNYILNLPAADVRTWDLVGESHSVEVPDPMPGRIAAAGGFDASKCVSPDPKNWRFAQSPRHSDVSGDGRSDILWHNSATGALYELQMNGLATGASGMVDQRADLNWKVAAVADLNNDGRADVVWQHHTTGQVYGLLMNGTTVTGQGTIYTEPNTQWKIVGAGDFNGDGNADLLWRNAATGDVFLLLMNGLAVTGGGVIYSEPNASWQIQKVADFNGDGRADVLWRNTATGDVYMMLMNGTTVAGGGVVYSEPNAAWQIQAAADYDGDGRADVLWRNTTTGDVYMMLMNGTTITGGSVFYGEPNAAWKIVASGDYNGDGRADILWRHAGTGQVYMMLMNGFAISQGGFVYTEPDPAWKILGP